MVPHRHLLAASRSAVVAVCRAVVPVAALVAVWCGTAASAIAADAAAEQLDFADSLYVRQMYDMAAEEYAKYIERAGDSPQTELALFRMAECYYNLKRYRDAATACERLRAEFPTGEKSLPALLRLGEIQLRLGEYGKAVVTLEELLGRDVDEPFAATALYFLGKASLENGDARKSVATFDRLVTTYPDNALVPYARFTLGAAYLALGDYRNAAEQFVAVSKDATVPETVRAESLFKAGVAYSESGQLDTAMAALHDTVASFPASPFAEQAMYEQGWVAYRADRYEDALRLADAFLEKYPDGTWSPGARYLKGRCYQSQAKYAEAEKVYRRLVADNPASPFAVRAKYQLCWTEYWQGRDDAAASRAEALAEEIGDELRGELMFVYGLSRFAEGRFADALDRFATVVAKYPKSKFAAEAEFHYARCLAELGRHADAATAFSEFARRRPEDNLAPEARFNAAQQEFLAGEFTSAADRFATLADSAADAATRRTAQFMAGRANQQANQLDAATDAYGAYLESFPNGPDAAEALYQLGVIWQQRKDVRDAVAAYDRLIANYASSPFASRARRNLGYLYYENGEMEKAAEAFVGLLSGGSSVPLRPDTLLWLANHLYDHADFKRARTAYEQYAQVTASETDKQFATVRAAECALNSGDIAGADTIYRKVIDGSSDGPYRVVAELGLGRTLLAADETDEAVEHLTRVIEVGDPAAVAEARALLGDAYLKLGRDDEALRAYMMVAMVYDHPELSPQCYIKAADILKQQGDSSHERKLYEDLISAYPDSDAAAVARARLDAGADDRGS